MERKPTPWAVICPTHGKVFLDGEEYFAQVEWDAVADISWVCPICDSDSEWDDDNYKKAIELAFRVQVLRS
jgi:hypothetical protein